MSIDAVHASERAFFDSQAAAMDAERMPPGPLDPYTRAIIDALGPLDGVRVLEVGCGAGDLTLELVRLGAEVTALDLSSRLVGVTRARLTRWAPECSAEVRVAPLEATGLPSDAFARVCGKWVLHHLDVAAAGAEIARVLEPGGRAVFFENHDRNPLLRVARRRLLGLPGVARVGTLDERPLSAADFDALRERFAEVRCDYPGLYLAEIASRQLLHHRLNRELKAVDSWLWRRVPRLRPYGYHVLLTLRRAVSRPRT